MRYTVEDTPEGFRITLHGGHDRWINEDGGHGPVEALFVATEQTWYNLTHGGMSVEREAALMDELGQGRRRATRRASDIEMKAPDIHEAARLVAQNIKILRDHGPLGEYERGVLERVENDYIPAIKAKL